MPHSSPRLGVSSRRRLTVAAAIGVLAGAVSGLVVAWPLTPLVAWDVAAAAYSLGVWRRIWPMDAQQTSRHALREDPSRGTSELIILSAAVASLVAVGYVLVRAGTGGGLTEGLEVAFGVASVVVSWTVVHTVFTLRYARVFYGGEPGGVDFHQDGRPRYTDFAYLAFTVGMTFQVSDTELNTSPVRATVLRHALLSYLFGTVIVALTINLVAGLSR